MCVCISLSTFLFVFVLRGDDNVFNQIRNQHNKKRKQGKKETFSTVVISACITAFDV